MTELELIVLDKAIPFDKLQIYFFLTAKGFVKRLCLQSSLLNIFPEVQTSVEMAALIDFPDGLQSSQCRLAEALYSIRSGAKYIDVVVNNILIQECNFKKIKREYKSYLELCNKNDVVLRPVLEYRLHDFDTLSKLCEQFADVGITEVISATGRMSDDFSDNLLFCRDIQSKLNLNVTMCGRIFSKLQYENLDAAGIKGARIAAPNTLEKIVGPLT